MIIPDLGNTRDGAADCTDVEKSSQPGPADAQDAPITGNVMSGRAHGVVQAGTVDQVHLHGDRRLLPVTLAAVAVLALTVALIAWIGPGGSEEKPAPPDVPLAAKAVVGLKPDCKSGWVLPDHGDEPIPYGRQQQPEGSVLGTGGRVTITLQGLTGDSVVLQDMRPEVLKREAAVRGVLLPGHCGSDVTPRSFELDLGSPVPSAVPQDGSRGGETVKNPGFPYQVHRTDPEQFIITVASPDEYVEWQLRLKWTSGDRSGELVVDDGGKPFRTTAVTAARQFCIEYPEMERWIPEEMSQFPC
ncbi:hypothetical protein Q5530_16790 [Saccharothrix sp. BKS2]|uniref:hypothetical protein n=1 Tax=Saccharothrix sp. BKS2 TaxID=3064400 RepID=UPI0039E8DFF8